MEEAYKYMADSMDVRPGFLVWSHTATQVVDASGQMTESHPCNHGAASHLREAGVR